MLYSSNSYKKYLQSVHGEDYFSFNKWSLKFVNLRLMIFMDWVSYFVNLLFVALHLRITLLHRHLYEQMSHLESCFFLLITILSIRDLPFSLFYRVHQSYCQQEPLQKNQNYNLPAFSQSNTERCPYYPHLLHHSKSVPLMHLCNRDWP